MDDDRHGQVFRGRIITVSTEQLVQPDGQVRPIEVARHPGGSAIVAVNERYEVCLLRQYRSTIGDWLWEIPAGKLDPGESAESTAHRELVEEAGVDARQWRSLGEVVPCPGFADERISLYLATDLQPADTAHEAGEYIEIHWIALADALDMVERDQIRDAKTAIGLFRAARALGRTRT